MPEFSHSLCRTQRLRRRRINGCNRYRATARAPKATSPFTRLGPIAGTALRVGSGAFQLIRGTLEQCRLSARKRSKLPLVGEPDLCRVGHHQAPERQVIPCSNFASEETKLPRPVAAPRLAVRKTSRGSSSARPVAPRPNTRAVTACPSLGRESGPSSTRNRVADGADTAHSRDADRTAKVDSVPTFVRGRRCRRLMPPRPAVRAASYFKKTSRRWEPVPHQELCAHSLPYGCSA